MNAIYFMQEKPEVSYGPLAPIPVYMIQSLSMFIQTFSFLALIVPEKSDTKIFKNGKILKPIKGHNSKSYGPLTPIPVHTIHPVIIHVYKLSAF